MKTICSAVALAIALPTLAFAQTNAPATSEHEGHAMPAMDHDKMDHKDMDCEKMKAEGKKMDCCDKHAKDKDKASADAHAGHEGQH
ncbi:hypothetical protein [Rhizorhapis sp.]|uniref:hypothetical protein n=1 Tax=Rhizorhapis sp. TaxID=1968842 RepID=UPI002B4865C5|nr:hypothetical protein [Rhizorhapis sp.]HKR16598.1 hypothetical protein [Rhizorhapis sp.]